MLHVMKPVDETTQGTHQVARMTTAEDRTSGGQQRTQVGPCRDGEQGKPQQLNRMRASAVDRIHASMPY